MAGGGLIETGIPLKETRWGGGGGGLNRAFTVFVACDNTYDTFITVGIHVSHSQQTLGYSVGIQLVTQKSASKKQ